MNSRLQQIQNWPELTRKSNWHAATLAKNCGVSLRTLLRFFRKHTGKSPRAWLVEQRQEHAAKLTSQPDSSVKVTAIDLGYKHPTHFSRDFKKYWGVHPTQTNRISPVT